MQIIVNNVSYTYNVNKLDNFEALKDISLSIEKGDFVALVGKTGSGKSTLIQTFNGLLQPTKGFTKIDEFIVTSDKKLKKKIFKEDDLIKKANKKAFLLRKKVGMVFQFPEYQLFEQTVLKDVMFGPLNFKVAPDIAKQRAIKSLNSVNIDESYFERSPFELSGGEKRRVAIAGVLASDPDILVLDEPTAGLDPNGKIEIMNLVKKIHNEGKTIILVTHDMDVVMNYANKVFVLNDSKLIDETTPVELFNTKDLSKLSLEIPTFYKVKNLLKNKGFAGNLEKIDTFDQLIDLIYEVKHD
ncbi:MAG: energy-coupling factor transporter ATPase [Mollicutes bacterium]|nr:energy-coupling factor transporter ATPase [Mollicutes bacterium]MDD7263604.1 energy-coupling factor transporter ATPase [bacterium]MDY4979910.1 energy-coupling factor transporter ATPase [Candidatus Onthovivens sp.]